MTDPNANPYDPPKVVSEELRRESRVDSARLGVVFVLAFLGANVGGWCEMLIYANDPRTGTSNGPPLWVVVVGGAVLCGVVWALIGWIAGANLKRIYAALFGSIIFALGWILIGGTYTDVLGAATVFAWPLGGIIGVAAARFLE